MKSQSIHSFIYSLTDLVLTEDLLCFEENHFTEESKILDCHQIPCYNFRHLSDTISALQGLGVS